MLDYSIGLRVKITRTESFSHHSDLEICLTEETDCLTSPPRPNTVGPIGYMGDGFYRSKDPSNSIKALKENATKKKQNTHIVHNKEIHI